MAETKDDSSPSTTKPLRVIMGTMTYGGQTDEAGSKEQLEMFIRDHADDRGLWEIDTARMYGHGKTEDILGDIFDANPDLRSKFIVASKVNPFKGYNESLTPESVRAQATAITSALKHPSVDILYLHAPDIHTPIESTLEAVNDLYRAGVFRELGLSNYPAWGVMEIHAICERKGYVKPTLYQAMYNAITRDIERELIPCLRRLRMRLYVYNPLAGGALTGKHRSMEAETTGTRFDKSNAMYRSRYWRKSVFDALEVVRGACDKEGISMADAALRWVRHHSLLEGGENDGVIIGASSSGHLAANIASCKAGPLPAEIVKAYDDAWEICRADCPKYFRP